MKAAKTVDAKGVVETPLMKQYNEIKSKYPDALLLFRVGDFYETFGEDAVKASGILGIVLTRRANGAAMYIELAGFPHHSLEKYARVLDHLRDVGMHLEIHHSDGLLNDLLLKIPQGIELVIDHFGRPKTNDEFLKNGEGIYKHRERIWVKLSAQYRTKHINHHAIFKHWLTQIGPSRLLWGSDWPHTGYEASQNYSQQLSELMKLVNDQNLSQQILSENPRNLYWTTH